jgi:CYTH domain-containing protein/nucleoside-triphosphatase THEP1
MMNNLGPVIVPSNVKIIAITGGPCGGKTEIIPIVREELENCGVHVITIPELATEFCSNGMACGRHLLINEFERQLLMSQIERELACVRAAAKMPFPRIVILTDRGRLDVKAYVDQSFKKMVEEIGYDEAKLCDFYSAVFHLQSLSVEFPDKYDLFCKNNIHRRENAAEAKAVDQKTMLSWLAHPHLRVVSSSGKNGELINLREKAHRLLEEICSVLGIPVPLEIEKKYLVSDFPDIPVPYEVIDITQFYTRIGNTGEERYRSRSYHGGTTYCQTLKNDVSIGVREELNLPISKEQYEIAKMKILPGSIMITKRRFVFIWENQYFEFDVFQEKMSGLFILEIELTKECDAVKLPPFINVIKEVTDDASYYNRTLAFV